MKILGTDVLGDGRQLEAHDFFYLFATVALF